MYRLPKNVRRFDFAPGRKIAGKYVMLSRKDRENLYLATSDDVGHWSETSELGRPARPWEICRRRLGPHSTALAFRE